MVKTPQVRADEVHHLLPQVAVWNAYDPACRTDLASTLYRTEAGQLFLVDPVGLAPAAFDELEGWGEPAAVLLTNGNHDRASLWWAQRWKVPRLSHPDAFGELAKAPDSPLADGDLLGNELRVIALPGAGAGEVALFHLPTGTLTFGDAVVNLPGHECAPLPAKYCTDPRQARASLRKLAGLDVRQMTFAHGWPVVDAAAIRLRDLFSTAGS